MAELTYLQAISDGLRLELRRDKRVYVIGEDVGVYGGAFKVTQGFQEEFGPWRVIDAPLSETAIVGGSDAYRAYLRTLGLRFDDLTGRLAETDSSSYSLILCRDQATEAARLRPFVEGGGNLIVHRVTQDGWPEFSRTFDLPEMRLEPFTGAVTRVENMPPILGAINREDVYWLGEFVNLRTPRASEMADGRFRLARRKAFASSTARLVGARSCGRRLEAQAAPQADHDLHCLSAILGPRPARRPIRSPRRELSRRGVVARGIRGPMTRRGRLNRGPDPALL